MVGRFLKSPFVFVIAVSLLAAVSASADVDVTPLSSSQMTEAEFDPAASAGLFVGVAQFFDVDGKPSEEISEVPYAVDDAVDLAYLFTIELGLISPRNVTIAVSGKPVSEKSRKHLAELVDSGARETNAGYINVLRLLDTARKVTGSKGLFIVSFATHGYILTATSEQRLFGQDSTIDDLNLTGIPVNRIFEKVSQSEAPRRLVFLDACRARVQKARAFEDPKSAMSKDFAKAIAEAKGMVIMQGTTPGGYSFDDHLRQNGVFTAELISGLRGAAGTDARGFITPSTLAAFVDKNVKRWVKSNRPNEASLSAGISWQTEDLRAANMPLAVNSKTMSQYEAEQEHRGKLLGLLRSHLDFKVITGAMVDEIAGVLERGQKDQIAPLMTQLEFLETLGDRYRAPLADWWRQNRNSFVPGKEVATEPMPSKKIAPEVSATQVSSTQVSAPLVSATLAEAPVAKAVEVVDRRAPVASVSALSVPPGFTVIDLAVDAQSGLPIRIRHDATGYELVLVSAGEFNMGSPDAEGEPDEHPHRKVYLDAYWIGATPVLNKQFKLFRSWHSTGGTMKNTSDPATDVDWHSASGWCKWAGMELPTEAEWERAAQGIAGNREAERSRLVGGSSQNPYQVGFLEKAGLVREWCADWYSAGSYAASSRTNPTGPPDGSMRSMRGSSVRYFRVAERMALDPANRDRNVGFRAVLRPVKSR